MTAAVLHRAARALRNPYLCNWSTEVARALADWLTHVAELQAIADLNRDEVQFLDPAVTTARALLRSFGHECADSDEPCRSCALTPEPLTEGETR